MVTVFTKDEFDESPHTTLKAAANGPVFIVDCGRPSYVLLTIEDYQGLTNGHLSLAEALGQPGADFGFDPPKASDRMFKSADFS